MPNAYAHSRTEDEFATPEYPEVGNGYAVPTGDAPYNDEFGWAPTLRLSPQGIPDGSRLGSQPRRDLRPEPDRPPEEFWRRYDTDDRERHSVEHITTNLGELKARPGDINPALGANRWARNPRETPPPENRVTQRAHPVMYFFTRPFDQRFKRSLTGVHFSMADHRREYEVLGMAPAKTRRNTFRIEPSPWDTDIVDMPAPDTTPDLSPVPGIAVNYGSASGDRSWRLT